MSLCSNSCLWVRTTPRIEDPAEMKTILLFSLRSLWGEVEPFSSAVAVRHDVEKSRGLLVIECPSAAVNQVRAALTLVSPPPYLEDTFFQFDVIDIQCLPLETQSRSEHMK